jgi:hypothetical protein
VKADQGVGACNGLLTYELFPDAPSLLPERPRHLVCVCLKEDDPGAAGVEQELQTSLARAEGDVSSGHLPRILAL